MDLDDPVCLCFHVSKRKLLNFLRIVEPQRAGQLSDCLGAGTGCGWCRRYLEQLFDEHCAGEPLPADEPTAQQHALGRQQYLQDRGEPPAS